MAIALYSIFGGQHCEIFPTLIPLYYNLRTHKFVVFFLEVGFDFFLGGVCKTINIWILSPFYRNFKTKNGIFQGIILTVVQNFMTNYKYQHYTQTQVTNSSYIILIFKIIFCAQRGLITLLLPCWIKTSRPA